MDLNILKIDLDLKFITNAKRVLKERLSYLNDMGVLDYKIIKSIVLGKKTSYNAKIILKEDVKDEKNIIILQLMLGSDYMKEVNTFLNHFIFNMRYSNRMFDVKRYQKGVIKESKKTDVTKEILDYVSNKNNVRKKFKN